MKILTNTILVIFFSILGIVSYKILYESNEPTSKKPIYESIEPLPKKTKKKNLTINSAKPNTALKQKVEIKKTTELSPPPPKHKQNYFYRLTLANGGEINGIELTQHEDTVQINSKAGITFRIKEQEIEKIEKIDAETNSKKEITLMSLVKNES